MADTSFRLLRLLSLLGTGRRWSLADLAERLAVSTRTVRRDVETLRRLDYPVTSLRGPDGGYRLGGTRDLPPLVLDEDQALATAVALQTAPTTVYGLDEDAARALDVLTRALPARVRAAAESMPLTRLRNDWEFSAPPIDAATLRVVGRAVRRKELLVVELLRPDGTRAAPRDADFAPPERIEPHHLVVWAGRWYLVVRVPAADHWRVLRVDRLHVQTPTGVPFIRREVPGRDVALLVRTSHDRGDVPARWQCTGSARMPLPAGTVARWAPGGSVVEELDGHSARITLGAWSWAGIAGLLATFDVELTAVEPPELVEACLVLSRRFAGLDRA